MCIAFIKFESKQSSVALLQNLAISTISVLLPSWCKTAAGAPAVTPAFQAAA